ncbi:DUF4893 domain-containing protein [Mesorhizobium temperatum]|uniref:DUF4893 domain-containing protein n=1 Tax=Mesorhizobium temperatum TaxID=241416 RepID=A0A271LIJ7_9HYPH|nr:DUF4893 domain-containing protein [Mesorhizobium temperatum]PAQ07150.1 DUF4893 domain-containing protein [Mesorhizobium temperatum]
MIARLLIAAGVVCFALPALADGEVQKLITPADKVRLDKYDETRKAALDEARAGDAADVKQLDALLAKPLVSFSDKDLTGNWQCRTIKTGGLSPLVIYGWFKCKVSDDGSGWMLEKITGSQRTKGRFFDDGEKRSIYLGSLSVNDDPAKPYGGGPQSDQVGYTFRNSANEWRIELPAPYYESKLDILEFKR